MAIQFRVSGSPPRRILKIDRFLGVDFYNAPANVALNRSPDAPNMIRDEVGKVRKRMGYEVMASYPARINGCHVLKKGEKETTIIHAGTCMYLMDTVIYSNMNDKRSRSFQFKGKLYILDGKTYTVFDGTTLRPVSEIATIPTILISRSPTGGGTPLQPLNFCSAGFSELFLGKADVKDYLLSNQYLDSTEVVCHVMEAGGAWRILKEGTHFTVDRIKGKVSFVTAPGASPVTGQDNVKITAYRTRGGYHDRINNCDLVMLYGVDGASDRVFVGGNPITPNIDYFSEFNDPTYFGDTHYTPVCQENTQIMGYSVISNQLATHIQGDADGRNVILRRGVLDENGNALVPVTNTLQGVGAISKFCFANVGKEPLFLTKNGVYAVTAEDVTGEKYSGQRSLYISTALQNEPNLADAFAFVWRDFYMLSINERVYVLDSLQKHYEPNAPLSSFQYESYFLTDIDARVAWEAGGALWFGTKTGKVCRVFNDPDNLNSYYDDGRAIAAYWDTPDIDGGLFYQNKTFRYVALRLASAIMTGVKISVQVQGIWGLLFDGSDRGRYFDWNFIDFSKFTFSTDKTPRTISGKIKVKKVDKARFRLENSQAGEPFGIFSVALEYTERGKYKT